jgi:hypothetical protein
MCHACSCAAGAGTSCFLTEVCFLLRKGHFTLAHGEEKDYQKPSAINATKGYLHMLNQFSDSAHPLLPNKTMADVLSL